MINLYPRPFATSSGDGIGGDNVDGFRVFYGIAVVCLSIFLFCVLAASVSVWKACAFAAMAALVLTIVGFFAPKRWVRRSRSRSGRRGGVEAELAAGASPAGVRQRPAANALWRTPANAPLAFVYECPLESDGAGGDKTARAGSCVVCSVCLEDIRGGETVRRLPACRHLFHVECIDMWLHSHRTCPMCRCVVSPPARVAAKAAADEVLPESSADNVLPPV